MTLRRKPREARDPFLEEMGWRVRDRRRDLGLSLRDLSDRTGRSYSFLCDVENGLREPGAATLWRLSRALGVTIDWIVKGDNEDVR